ncbi:CDP-glycerol glycerophosphotransferase family protein [Acinetobacter faecalis]|uniref:CDP-glycerol glycerophosphotransferase family protein n=1 Tax=Acinetobacter faecalis TaxID=2665161 RepID=UPI002A912915|nr:CDP-glycerol glycerophosphotransferase family protein [Acinetobacter faecalis]MDY6462452.1 CDP-glycerol glycerophosphotransferase family protein [Acinetobacter faecalis]
MMLLKLDAKVQRKLKKLKRDPNLFFKDMVAKKKIGIETKITKLNPIKSKTKNKFTIVSAVYNVSKYLDDYFESIVNQSVSFKDSIYIICVDDGSTDNSADIIKKWQKKYPKNIQYIYKENGGQSSARNLGLDYVKTDWVTFIDADDFLHINFFSEIDKELVKNNNLKIIAPNFIFYFEDIGIKQDTHPLKYKFNKTNKVVCRDLKSNVHLHAASTVFNLNIINNNRLKFNTKLKPTFEDGKFVADYLLLCPKSEMLFLKSAIYYYRKRSDSSSTLDTAWYKKERFSNVLTYGHLEMLMSYQEKLGYVPTHIQRTSLYDIVWYVRYLINNDFRVDFLTENEKSEFLKKLFKIFQYIDSSTILDFNLAGCWFKQKVGILGYFKNEAPNFQITYIENIDRENKQILISFFTTLPVDVSYKINGTDTLPKFYKSTKNTFVGNTFVNENRAWLSYENLSDSLEIVINNKKARISLFGKQHTNGIMISHIIEKFSPSLKYDTDGSWILMDRNTQADDNAEHLYRYILENNLKQDCYFALNRDSSDWARLEQEGFKLLEFGSDEFESKLKHCSKIISSHLDHYINNYFGDEYEYSKKFVFLQHGVTKDDMSSWFNSKKNLQCLITATQPEYLSIISNNSRYKLTEKEVVLTGFPRHDRLLKQNLDEKIILIMPTWRNTIVGKTIGDGNERALNDAFMETLFAQSWYKLIHSPKLKQFVDQYGYKVVFAPHANIEPYLDQFAIPSYMSIWSIHDQEGSIQDLFQKAKIMLTDYSSVAFEMAYLDKAIVYYQFDKETIYQGGHIYQKGYFEYERDGFGPVVEQVDQVEHALEQILQNNGQPLSEYLTRMQDTFKFKDGRCCERVYNAIVALEHEENEENLELALKFLNSAYNLKNYELVRERAEKILLTHVLNDNQKEGIWSKLAESYVQLKDKEALGTLLEYYNNDYYISKWLETLTQGEHILDITGREIISDEYFTLRLSNLFKLNQLDTIKLNKCLDNASDFSEYQTYLIQCYIDYTNENWADLVQSLNNFQDFALESNYLIDMHTRENLLLMKLVTNNYLKKSVSSNIKSLKI